MGHLNRAKIKLYFREDQTAWYDSPGGQRILLTLPAGFSFEVPASYVYSGFPVDLDVLKER
jgi:hypothetical protein